MDWKEREVLSVRLLKMIENHAEELTTSVVGDLQRNPKTTAYSGLSLGELRQRVNEVFRDFGQWLEYKPEETMETWYRELGRRRLAEGVPLAELVEALTLTKYHLQEFVRSAGLVDSALEIYQEMELQRLVDRFFDKAIYYSVEGYTEKELRGLEPAAVAAPAPRSQ